MIKSNLVQIRPDNSTVIKLKAQLAEEIRLTLKHATEVSKLQTLIDSIYKLSSH